MTHCSNIVTIAGRFATKIVPCKNVPAFCGFLQIFELFFLVRFETHAAFVVIACECTLSDRKAKISRLAIEGNTLGLIHRHSIMTIAIRCCHFN